MPHTICIHHALSENTAALHPHMLGEERWKAKGEQRAWKGCVYLTWGYGFKALEEGNALLNGEQVELSGL